MKVLTVTLNPALDREIIIDNFQEGLIYRIPNSRYKIQPGGAGINISIMLSNLGVKSVAMGFLGGFTGRIIASRLNAYQNISTNFVLLNEYTRTNFELVNMETGKTTYFMNDGPSIGERDIKAFLRRYERSVNHDDIKIVVIGGSIPDDLQDDIYYKLVKIAKEKGKFVILESKGKAFEKALEAKPDLVKPNFRRSKVHKLLDKRMEKMYEYVEVGNEIIKMGVKGIILSYQVKNDIVCTQEKDMLLAPKYLDIKSIYGASDAYTTGLVYAILNDYQGENIYKFGMAAAIADASKYDRDLENVSEIEKELENISVEYLK